MYFFVSLAVGQTTCSSSCFASEKNLNIVELIGYRGWNIFEKNYSWERTRRVYRKESFRQSILKSPLGDVNESSIWKIFLSQIWVNEKKCMLFLSLSQNSLYCIWSWSEWPLVTTSSSFIYLIRFIISSFLFDTSSFRGSISCYPGCTIFFWWKDHLIITACIKPPPLVGEYL